MRENRKRNVEREDYLEIPVASINRGFENCILNVRN